MKEMLPSAPPLEVFMKQIELPEVISAPRTDPIYNAHGYLTKVPVDAILPYLLQFTRPGELVVDMFAGSGMTAVACRIAGRRAIVSDISVLGQHIGTGYLTPVDATVLRTAGAQVVDKARQRLSGLYNTVRETDESTVQMVRTVWSFIYECPRCKASINFYRALQANNWKTPAICTACREPLSKAGARHLRDEPVVVVVLGEDGKQREQPVGAMDRANIERANQAADLGAVPSLEIEAYREMYKRSALGKWNLKHTKQFFASRNALALLYLWQAISSIADEATRKKLEFAFTAILPRASRRYQWSVQRPLNAANQTYYIAPVYYEWNVFELFERKVSAAIKADGEIYRRSPSSVPPTKQDYVLASAADLSHLQSNSVDYVFTDPPFGSNLFYSDMSLFQEAWLGSKTSDAEEAVMHTAGGKEATGPARYESILRAAFVEAFRVLKPGCCMSVVFGSSSGKVWAMMQRILRDAGFAAEPTHIAILDKGQRSVKGLASGYENVATLDLVVSVRKPQLKAKPTAAIRSSLNETVASILDSVSSTASLSPSHIYLLLLKQAFAAGLPVDGLHLDDVIDELSKRGVAIDPKTGMLSRSNGKM